MKILVIEDKKQHRDSARKTLEGHDVTIISSFNEAMDLTKRRVDYDKMKRLLKKAGFGRFDYSKFGKKAQEEYKNASKETLDAYREAQKQAEEESIIRWDFDVVLTDMMMPMSDETLTSDAFRYGEQVPYGFIIALRVTLCGTKFVAMVTDTNHHHGAMSAAIDYLGDPSYQEGFTPNFEINGAKVSFVHAPFVPDTGTDYLNMDKDWGQVLKDLIQE